MLVSRGKGNPTCCFLVFLSLSFSWRFELNIRCQSRKPVSSNFFSIYSLDMMKLDVLSMRLLQGLEELNVLILGYESFVVI